MKNQLAKIFQDNVGNRISVELANGMLQSIMTVIEKEMQANEDKIKKDLNLDGPE